MKKNYSLVTRNITILSKRTSIKLEPEVWEALSEIASFEKCTINDICSLVYIANRRKSLTSAVRTFIMLYFRCAATDEGHRKSGHGDISQMARRLGIDWEDFGKKSQKAESCEESTPDPA